MGYEVYDKRNGTIKCGLNGSEFEEKRRLKRFNDEAEYGWDHDSVESLCTKLVIKQAVKSNVRKDPDQEHPYLCDYELQPTDEWSRIQQALKELEELKSRLPVNADGDVVLWGDTQYCHKHGEFQVTTISDESLHAGCDGFYLNPFTKRVRIEESYSTAESCRAANEKGE